METRVLQLTSRVRIDQVDVPAECDYCGGTLAETQHDFRFSNTVGSQTTTIIAEGALALVCKGRCRGVLRPGEVMVDLLDQAIKMLSQCDGWNLGGLCAERVRFAPTEEFAGVL